MTASRARRCWAWPARWPGWCGTATRWRSCRRGRSSPDVNRSSPARGRRGGAASVQKWQGILSGVGGRRAGQADAEVGRAVLGRGRHHCADASDASRPRRPAGLPQFAEHPAGAARAGGRADRQRKRCRRDRGNPDRRQRQPVGACGQSDRRRSAHPADRPGGALHRRPPAQRDGDVDPRGPGHLRGDRRAGSRCRHGEVPAA